MSGKRGMKHRAYYVERDMGHATPCWIWQGGRGADGYGRVRENGRQRQAHHVYFTRAGGIIPVGHELHHRCGHPLCVNPEHLEPLTVAEHRRRSSSAKLTAEQVIEIRAIRSRALATQRVTRGVRRQVRQGLRIEVAEQFNVSPKTISSIWAQETWR